MGKKIPLDFWGELCLMKVRKQKHLIHKGDWDIIIILDACRYDYFKEEYKNFLSGELKKAHSPGSNTYTWLRLVFNKWYNITLYSAHPALNSLGIERAGYKALPHFRKIVDIWNKGWVKELSTVPSEEVNKTVLEDVKRGALKGKNIIWYMQPHAPWIGNTKLTGFGKGWNDKGWNNLETGSGKQEISSATILLQILFPSRRYPE